MPSDEMNADTTSSEEVDRERIRALGQMIRQKRITERLTLEQASTESRISAPTLSRLERQATSDSKSNKGFIMPDTRTIAAVVQWLGVSLGEALEVGTSPSKEQVAEPHMTDHVGTPEKVEAYLRADRNLNPQTAAMIAQMFRAAYEQGIKLSEGQSTTNQSQGRNTDTSYDEQKNIDDG